MKKTWKRLIPIGLAVVLFAGVAAMALTAGGSTVELFDLEDEAVPLASAVASGTQVKSGGNAVIDYSNIKDGYVMVKYNGSTGKRIKALVNGPTTKYQYNVTPGKWESFPLSNGNGNYEVGVYENVQDTKYSKAVSVTFNVTMTDQFAPFLRSNQYVDYDAAPNTVAKAAELCSGKTDTLAKVQAVYEYVIKNTTYDKTLASKVSSGQVTTYLPVLDSVLASKKGICFDYAALMAGMLRSQGVPTKLVVGYVASNGSSVYHAWISVWSEKTGWVEGVVFFDGTSWQRMDPTFASSGGQSASIMRYIGDGNNYSEKYSY